MRGLLPAITLLPAVLVVAGRARGEVPWPSVRLERVLSGLEAPVQVTHAGDGSGRLFIVQQGGKIRVAENGTLVDTPFLDVSGKLSTGGERGLLSVAFPPSFRMGGWCYVAYTDTAGSLVVARYNLGTDFVEGEEILLTVPHPGASNHNGGQLVLGPDGYLYVGTGDGGGAGDQANSAQSTSRLLGKILRIDVESQRGPYVVPPTNPFVSVAGARPEIWAYGLRNPWRFSFDRRSGDLWIGDVGQDAWEEIDVQPAASGGGENYGWHLMEGTHCYNPSSGCPVAGLTLPVAEYGHDVGCSVTGGFVYRGRRFESLWGVYLYGDYCSGRIWGLRRSASGGWETAQLLKTDLSISGFGEDEEGEIYVADLRGAVYRVEDVNGISEVRTVPIVLDVRGAGGARFTTELVLANRSTSPAALSITYTPALTLGAAGAGTFTDSLAAGRQVLIPDALSWLRSKGLPIPQGLGQGGTVRISATGLSAPGAFFALGRTTAPSGSGRAGTSYPALSPADLLEQPAWVFGLRQDAANRSNLALVNGGVSGAITLRVTLRSGVPGDARTAALPDVSLDAGQWTQVNAVLARAGFANGYALVERVAGTEPFHAYGVVNDGVTQDGSVVPPVVAGRKASRRTVPVAVETAAFSTELVVVNPGTERLTLNVWNHPQASLVLEPGEQRFIPSIRRYLDPGSSALGAGPLEVGPRGAAAEFLAGAATRTPAPAGGAYGVFQIAVARGTPDAWVYGLRQDEAVRSNLALEIVREDSGASAASSAPLAVVADVYDGDTSLLAGSLSVPLDPTVPDWVQVNGILSRFGVRNGYVHVFTNDGRPFSAYGVLNDGARPGDGTGDGSLLPMSR